MWNKKYIHLGLFGLILYAVLASTVQIRADSPVLLESPPSLTSTLEETVREEIFPVRAEASTKSSVTSVIASKKVDLRPRVVSIPSIGLERDVIDIGITSEGNLDVPPNYVQVGWYKYGTVPGQTGSAVLDGHVDNGGSVPGPFKRLREVKIGDEIVLTSADGTKQKFLVSESNIYPTDRFPGELVFHDKSDALIKIITCHGRYVPSLKTYDQRLIVTAKLVR